MSDKPLLLRNKGFFALVVTQFLGAFNDNAFITLITLFVTDKLTHQEEISRIVTLASALFAAPFLLFSTHAGFISDRVSKRAVAVYCKFSEIILSCLAFFALYSHHTNFLLVIIFLMGLHSTFFGPAKYGILPEILEERDLSNGNGIIQLTTFVGIILGIVAGGLMLQHVRPHVHYASIGFLIVAAGGFASSLFITRVPPATSGGRMEWNPVKQFYLNVKLAAKDRVLFLCLLGTGYFWLIGPLFKQDLLVYGKTLMQASDTAISLLMAILALGIGVGAGVAGKISGEKVELGLVPVGAVGIGAFAFDLMFASHSMTRVGADLFFVGFFSGFFIVPLAAMVQMRSDKNSKGTIIATSNVISFIGITAASGVMWLLSNVFHLDPAKVLGLVAVATVAGTVYVLWLIPVAFVRMVFWFMTHTVYRIKTVGRQNFPLKGPALLVCNHVSYIDPFLISTSVPRAVRFFMWRKIYDWKPLTWFFKLMKMIPISPADGPRRFAASMEEARQALKEGHIVCIFAEGAITRIAQTLGFKKGMEYIIRDLDVPVIPVHLDRVWGSIFSFHQGEFIWKIPRKLPYPVTVSFGKPLPSTAKVAEVRQAVLELGTDAFQHRLAELKPLHQTFLRQAKSLWFTRAFADSTGLDLTHGKAAAASVILARRMRAILGDGSGQVGVLLPPSVAGALLNVALPMAGKISVNLNFTLSRAIVEQTVKSAGIDKIITSSKMLGR
jgi:acyl-[acyl-carrier-protein]-phospholipid O-acyltransferase/long-chain-fatty-acid--[acyl-carrier-protein] ligase